MNYTSFNVESAGPTSDSVTRNVHYGRTQVATAGSVSRFHTYIHNYWKIHPTLLCLMILITLVSSSTSFYLVGWVGALANLLLGIASFLLGPYAIEKVREHKIQNIP